MTKLGHNSEVLPPATVMNSDSVGEVYWAFHGQTRDAWTFELDIHPIRDYWVMPLVEIHFDFSSPNAYLSHLVTPAIEA